MRIRFPLILPLAVTSTFAVFALAGCGAINAPDVRDQMVGLSEDQLTDCLGEPNNKEGNPSGEVWTYYERDGADVSPLDASVQPTATSQPIEDMGGRSCLVTVRLEAAKVMDVSYVNLATTRPDDECVSAIQRCAR